MAASRLTQLRGQWDGAGFERLRVRSSMQSSHAEQQPLRKPWDWRSYRASSKDSWATLTTYDQPRCACTWSQGTYQGTALQASTDSDPRLYLAPGGGVLVSCWCATTLRYSATAASQALSSKRCGSTAGAAGRFGTAQHRTRQALNLIASGQLN